MNKFFNNFFAFSLLICITENLISMQNSKNNFDNNFRDNSNSVLSISNSSCSSCESNSLSASDKLKTSDSSIANLDDSGNFKTYKQYTSYKNACSSNLECPCRGLVIATGPINKETSILIKDSSGATINLYTEDKEDSHASLVLLKNCIAKKGDIVIVSSRNGKNSKNNKHTNDNFENSSKLNSEYDSEQDLVSDSVNLENIEQDEDDWQNFGALFILAAKALLFISPTE